MRRLLQLILFCMSATCLFALMLVELWLAGCCQHVPLQCHLVNPAAGICRLPMGGVKHGIPQQLPGVDCCKHALELAMITVTRDLMMVYIRVQQCSKVFSGLCKCSKFSLLQHSTTSICVCGQQSSQRCLWLTESYLERFLSSVMSGA